MTLARSRKIIDIHCGWGATTAAPEWRDISAIKEAMMRRGIGTVFISALLGRRYDLIAGNEAVVGAVAPPKSEDETDVRGWMVIHPARTREVIDQMRRYLYSPRLIGAALYADPRTGLPVTAADARELITAFRRFGKPLLVETPTAAAMEEVVSISQDLAGVKIIASGMGGDEWREAMAVAGRASNLFIDISGALTPEKVEHAIQVMHGARKILFASGAPHSDPAAILGLLNDVDLSADDRERILHGNAEKLFGLGPAPDPNAGAQETPTSVIANYLIGNVENPEEVQWDRER